MGEKRNVFLSSPATTCNLLVSMTDDDAAKILRGYRRAMAGGGRVIIIEWIMPTGAAQADEFVRWDVASMDLNMLAIHGAGGWRVRTRDEFEQIIEAVGLFVIRVVPTTSAVSVVECAAASKAAPTQRRSTGAGKQ